MMYVRVMWQLLLLLPEMLRVAREIQEYFKEVNKRKLLDAIDRAKNASDESEAKKALDDIASGLK